ncbi:hydrolase, NUDIX family protein [Brugia malayi]|uniref:BMA-NDX-3 n=1 Tax=Brugia malayi TaxID=6279 RepID=A0A0J9YBT0_BRUMA|nr:hydrolase, NUDIX family protein [Brugia malayi]CDQ06106.1 BMA-NDX-3 [Brugia malayi]VIO94772.1 hydrolase, NUDIX family protein [Brugia malayi]
MYKISKRLSSTTIYQIVLDEQLRERFCERLKQQSINPIRSSYPIKRLSSKKRDSAVLIPLAYIDKSPSIIFTHRSLLLAGHRGEISFPGGRLEQDETYEQAALRESAEEIGLYSYEVEVWGCLKYITTRFMSTITPVVGLVHDSIDFSKIKAKYDEVQTVFAAPIDELCMKHRYTHFRKGNMEYKLPVFFTSRHYILATNVTPQNEYRIWGLTAEMLHLALLNLFPKFYQPKI